MYYDPAGLDRFLSAQAGDYDTALREIRAGRKRSHWMWYIFPQLRGLGFSSTAEYYGLRDLEEARDYMEHPVLSARLVEISEALLGLEGSNPSTVLGYPDDLKLRSCMTLFELAAPEQPVFARVLEKYYGGRRDARTLALLGRG